MLSNYLRVPATKHQRRLYTVFGVHAAAEPLLRLCAKIALTRKVRILDCGNRSDMYAVAKTLRPLTTDPATAMARVRLSRAFTCYQVEALLASNRSVLSNDLPKDTPVIVLDLLATFLDESINDQEIRRLFHESINHLQYIAQHTVVFIGISPIPTVATPTRSELVYELQRNTQEFIRLDDRSALTSNTTPVQLSLLG